MSTAPPLLLMLALALALTAAAAAPVDAASGTTTDAPRNEDPTLSRLMAACVQAARDSTDPAPCDLAVAQIELSAAGPSGANERAHADALSNRALIFDRRRDLDAALADIDAALALQPRRAELMLNRAAILLHRAEPAAALGAIEAVLAELATDDPLRAPALLNRSVALRALGELAAAAGDLQAAYAAARGSRFRDAGTASEPAARGP
jgi:tetratricopeptide (TPR) repeat protein